MKPHNIARVDVAWNDLLSAVSRFVGECSPFELALVDAIRLENTAQAIRKKLLQPAPPREPQREKWLD